MAVLYLELFNFLSDEIPSITIIFVAREYYLLLFCSEAALC